MKYSVYIVLLIIALAACSKNELSEHGMCNQMALNPNFKTEIFKPDYEIQFPTGYAGKGHYFPNESPAFHKTSTDNITFWYEFLCSTDCHIYFGDVLNIPFPDQVEYSDFTRQHDGVLLDQKIEYCIDEEPYMVFYFNTNFEIGKLFIKDEGEYKDALNINFKSDQLDEVSTILKTIRQL